MSPEWMNGKEEWMNGKESRQCDKALSEIEDIDPEELLKQILSEQQVQREEICGRHGPFTRTGYRWGNWIAWTGHDNVYGATWPECPGCMEDRAKWDAEWRAKNPDAADLPLIARFPVREFDLKTPAFCDIHGNFILWARLTEYSHDWATWASAYEDRITVGLARTITPCPECENEILYEQNLCEQLGLSAEEWERGREQILGGLDIAIGGYQQDRLGEGQ